MRALAAAHRIPEIHVFYRDFTRRLAAALGAEPSDEFTQLYTNLTTRRRRSALPALSAAPPRMVGSRDVPRDTPYFTGREDLLSELDKLTGPFVVAIDGPPGVGKTALVVRWVRRRENRFPDGVLY